MACKWLIIGVLTVRDDRIESALAGLRESRIRFNYRKEIHFSEIRNVINSPFGAKTAVARDWVSHFVHDRSGIWNIHLVAIRPGMLEHNRFGASADENIYARFFRSALRYAIKSTDTKGPASITSVFHDATHLEEHEYFPWHAIRNLENEGVATFRNKSVEFISSDHEEPGHLFPWAAELVQAVDVWIGVFRQILAMPSTNKGHIQVCEPAAKFIRTLNDPNHLCRPLKGAICEFVHRRRCSIGFFPNQRGAWKPGTQPSLEELRYFYQGERLAYFENSQESLFPGGT